MGSRQEAAQESSISRQTLDDAELKCALRVFRQLLGSAMGPHGQIQSIQNSVGGPITMTTSSSRLLSAMSFLRPCLRLIVSAVQGHLRNQGDGGLFVGSLCVHLITRAVECDCVPKTAVRGVYEVLLDLVDQYLHSDQCPVVVNVSLSHINVMLAFVRGIVSTKPVCSLRPSAADHLSQLFLRAFLNSVSETPKDFFSDQVFTLQFEKSDVVCSEVVEGLLLEWPEKSPVLGEQDIDVMKGTSQEVVTVALVSASMSGDAEEMLVNQSEAHRSVIQSASNTVMTKMLAFCDWLHENNVALLLCQKVIHPKLKTHLRQKKILFIERIGLQPMKYIQDVTGASPMGSVMTLPEARLCGQVDNLHHRVLHGKSCLHLQRAASCVSTVVLCAAFDEQLNELKSGMQSAMKGLSTLMRQPQVLCGAGCWQIHMADYIRHAVVDQKQSLCARLHLTDPQLMTATDIFASSLEATAQSLLDPHYHPWVDLRHHHLWPAPQGVNVATETTSITCGCGMLSEVDIDRGELQLLVSNKHSVLSDNEREIENASVVNGHLQIGDGVNFDWLVLDAVECGISAIRTAVMTAVTVLSISQYIHDVN